MGTTTSKHEYFQDDENHDENHNQHPLRHCLFTCKVDSCGRSFTTDRDIMNHLREEHLFQLDRRFNYNVTLLQNHNYIEISYY